MYASSNMLHTLFRGRFLEFGMSWTADPYRVGTRWTQWGMSLVTPSRIKNWASSGSAKLGRKSIVLTSNFQRSNQGTSLIDSGVHHFENLLSLFHHDLRPIMVPATSLRFIRFVFQIKNENFEFI